MTTVNSTQAIQPIIYPSLQWMVKFVQMFVRYHWIVVEWFGLPGNVISIFVSLKRGNRHVSTCIYIAALAAADSGLLLMIGWVNLIFSYNLPTSEFTLQ